MSLNSQGRKRSLERYARRCRSSYGDHQPA